MITGLRHALGVSRELELLYQVAEVRRGPPRSAEVRELLYQVAEVREVREVREVPGGYGPPTSSFASESLITTTPLAHAGENPLSYQAPP